MVSDRTFWSPSNHEIPSESVPYYDPLYGTIPVSPLIRRAIDLKTVQRLRHIKQLPCLDIVYPGATHTRFEHSVGVYHLATRVFGRLLEARYSSTAAQNWPALRPIHQLAVQLAAVFHDIGMGPLTPAFEMFCHLTRRIQADHSDVTSRLICEGLGRYDDIPPFLQSVAEKAKRMGDEHWQLVLPENIAALATGRPLSGILREYSFLSEIIHGNVAADRLDYVARDSLHTGVGMTGVDVWDIVRSYTLVPRTVAPPEVSSWQTVPRIDAAPAIEAVLTTRDLLMRRIYYHRTYRTAIQMIIRALHDVMPQHSVDQLRLLVDDELIGVFRSSESELAAHIGSALMDGRLYEPLPVRVNYYKDLDESARATLLRYMTPLGPRGYRRLLDWARDISDKIGMPRSQEIILDTLIFLGGAKRELIVEQILYDPYDPSGPRLRGLLDVLPHLRILYEGKSMVPGAAGEDVLRASMPDTSYRLFVELADLQILVPPDFIQESIDGAARHGQEQTWSEELLDYVFAKRFRPVAEALVSLLNFTESQKIAAFYEKFAFHVERMLRDRIIA